MAHRDCRHDWRWNGDMADQIDEFLAGRIGRDALTSEERSAADAAVRTIRETRTLLAQRQPPDVTLSVMARLAALPNPPETRRPSLRERLAALLWTPRQVAVRPAYAALTVAACLVLLWLSGVGRRSALLLTPTQEARVFVQFRLDAENAMRVQLAGSFTDWQPRYELHQSAPGIWTTMVPLPEGVHDYAFIVDGQRWVADPYSAQISDGFGGTNSRVTLLAPGAPRS